MRTLIVNPGSSSLKLRILDDDDDGGDAAVVATHDLAPPGSPPVWDPAHRRAAEALALAPHARPRLRVVTRDELQPQELLELGDGDYEVEVPDLSRYELGPIGCGCGSIR